MKTILLADSKIICNYKEAAVIWYNTRDHSIVEVLDFIEKEKPQMVFIYGELLLKGDSFRSKYQGIDLIKHIRLTPLKDNLDRLPIVLLHWLPVERYIESDLENIILFSPGIIRIRLPLRSVECEISTSSNADITPFLFHSEYDEEMSEHQFRNEIATNQFETESVSGRGDIKDKPVWYKKLFYQQGYSVDINEKTITKSRSTLRLLLIDDLGEKWKSALQKVLPDSTIEVCRSISEAEAKIASIQKQILERRKLFADNASKQFQIIAEIRDKKEELRSISEKISTEEIKYSNTQNSLEKAKNDLENYKSKLLELLKELTKNDGILDALLSFRTEGINTDTKRGISNLSQFITNISNTKENISNAEQLLNSCNRNIQLLSEQRSNREGELQKLISSYRTISINVLQSFELLFNSDSDLILLDMHLTKDSEGKEYEQMDGYKVLSSLRSFDLKIPVIIFSATKRNLSALMSEFGFLQRTIFLKGITPVNNFISLVNNMEIKNAGKRIGAILDEVIVFPSYKLREYKSYDSPLYETREINQSNRSRIIEQLKTIQSDLENYIAHDRTSYLQNIVLKLGNILREYRLKVTSSAYDRNNSLFHKMNCEKNKIASQCTDLIYWRNRIEHPPQSNSPERSRYDEWLSKLDLREVEGHIKTVYEGLIFDK